MKKLQLSLDDNLPGNAYVRMTAVVKGHQTAINELDSDVIETNRLIVEKADTTEDRISKLENRIETIENIWYRRSGRWIKRALWRLSSTAISIFRKKRES